MAKYRQVHTTFWDDAFVLDLTPEEKYFYLYLMTNNKTTQCGIYELPKRVIEMHTGYNRETVDKLLQRFVDYEKIIYNDKTKEIMMRNWAKYNFINSPKVKACIEKELETVKFQGFIDEYLDELKKHGYGIDTVSKKKDTVPIDHREEEEKNNKNKNNNKKKKSSHKYETCDIDLAKKLFNLILETDNHVREPNFEKWANDIRLMREKDGRTVEQIDYLITWSHQHHFWKSNILSTAKLREKATTLIAQIKGEKEKKVNIGTHQKQNSLFKPSEETLERQNKLEPLTDEALERSNKAVEEMEF
ncbi:hypothetical protein [Priestia flexa]|uniref:hypothetical protein n=1 Tax=Priestia flexa TaxID=86664 RepID=UPI003D009EB4